MKQQSIFDHYSSTKKADLELEPIKIAKEHGFSFSHVNLSSKQTKKKRVQLRIAEEKKKNHKAFKLQE